MHTALVLPSFAALALALVGCPTPMTPDVPGTDTGGTDSGRTDSGGIDGGGTDSGGIDGGGMDSGGTDTGGTDAGGMMDAGSDAGPAGSLTCSAAPFTMTLGATIDPSNTGVVLCMGAGSCRITNNTFSDGADACPTAQSGAFIGIDSTPTPSGFFFTSSAASGVTTMSCDIGTPLAPVSGGYRAIPLATTITCVVVDAASARTRIVFSFPDPTTIRVESVGPP